MVRLAAHMDWAVEGEGSPRRAVPSCLKARVEDREGAGSAEELDRNWTSSDQEGLSHLGADTPEGGRRSASVQPRLRWSDRSSEVAASPLCEGYLGQARRPFDMHPAHH